MTAVEFAVQKLEKFIVKGNQIAVEAILEQAKEMEKEKAERMYSEEEVYKMLLNYQSNYPYASNEIGLKKWFEEIKKNN